VFVFGESVVHADRGTHTEGGVVFQDPDDQPSCPPLRDVRSARSNGLSGRGRRRVRGP
jgi:hypothetical protein